MTIMNGNYTKQSETYIQGSNTNEESRQMHAVREYVFDNCQIAEKVS